MNLTPYSIWGREIPTIRNDYTKVRSFTHSLQLYFLLMQKRKREKKERIVRMIEMICNLEKERIENNWI